MENKESPTCSPRNGGTHLLYKLYVRPMVGNTQVLTLYKLFLVHVREYPPPLKEPYKGTGFLQII